MKRALQIVEKLKMKREVKAFVYTRINGKEILKFNANDVLVEDMYDVFEGCEVMANGDGHTHTLSIAI